MNSNKSYNSPHPHRLQIPVPLREMI